MAKQLSPSKFPSPANRHAALPSGEQQLDVHPHTPSRTQPLTCNLLFSQVRWFNLTVEALLPLLSVYGLCTTRWTLNTALFTLACYTLNMIGITAGYHRLWSHRSYNASLPLQYFLALAGAGAVQGSIRWWARGHRSHHRYTDTDLDPYGAHHGLFWTHIGWMLVKPRVKPGYADVRDLQRNAVVQWQHNWYFALALGIGLALPWAVAGWLWGDWRGGFYYVCFLRLLCVHHSTFCVNSIAHFLGSATYDDKHTPRDHVITALLTLGEGYHNFHHQFPMDYRNAVKWYQYDPTKWFIGVCALLGFASHLKMFPENEIKMGELSMQLKKLKEVQDGVRWPKRSDELPVIGWETFQAESRSRPLVLVSGFIHDITDFLDQHPGGRDLLQRAIGTDATAAFFGGVYDHSHAAHNLLTTLRVGALHGGLEHVDEHALPPAQKLFIAEATTLQTHGDAPPASNLACHDTSSPAKN